MNTVQHCPEDICNLLFPYDISKVFIVFVSAIIVSILLPIPVETMVDDCCLKFNSVLFGFDLPIREHIQAIVMLTVLYTALKLKKMRAIAEPTGMICQKVKSYLMRLNCKGAFGGGSVMNRRTRGLWHECW